MSRITAPRFLTAVLGTSLIVASGFAIAHDKPAHEVAVSETKPAFMIDMKKGEVLQVIASELRTDGAAAARQYGQTAFPIAQRHGFKRLGQLNVTRNAVSDYEPQAFSFFSWPSQKAVDAFDAEPEWPAVKATRPQAWSELKVFSSELKEDLTLSFSPDKHYTVLVAWLKSDDDIADYNRYLTGIEPAVARSGGQFLYKMRLPSMEAHASDPKPPHQLTFVEWESTDGFAKVQQTQEYLDHREYFSSSMERFEFYWLKAPK